VNIAKAIAAAINNEQFDMGSPGCSWGTAAAQKGVLLSQLSG
jgi:hypothetical protein